MKIIRFSDGLANRMFQYSYYLYLKKLGFEVALDDSTPHYLEHDEVDWIRIFPNAYYLKAPKNKCLLYGGGFDIFSKILRHYLKCLSKCRKMDNAFETPSTEQIKKFNYFIGVMLNANMVDEVREEVKKAFKFTDFEPNSSNLDLVKEIKSNNSISIHVRKGKDYMNRTIYNRTCSIDYYLRAIEYMNNHVQNPHFYVFTDNPQWVKMNLKDIDYIIIENNPTVGWGNHFDMQLMSCCKHNIIANSTYSWWGAYLNPNNNKIVICPKDWFNPQKYHIMHTMQYTICKGWITM